MPEIVVVMVPAQSQQVPVRRNVIADLLLAVAAGVLVRIVYEKVTSKRGNT